MNDRRALAYPEKDLTMQEEQTPRGLSEKAKAAVRIHLKEVIASEAFKGGRRAQEFLALIVEHGLEGRWDNLKERMLGAEMFGRPIDYDTANDAVVRVKASEVRRRLTQYYREQEKMPEVVIDLPPGAYMPRFLFAGESELTSVAAEELPPVKDKQLWWTRKRVSIAAALLIVLGVTCYLWWRTWPFSGDNNGPIQSIAILPLENLSGDPGQEYFADGMTEELTTALGQISSLRVISRTSTMTYKGTRKNISEIARELHVDALVEGSIGREGNRVRITTQLIDARIDRHIWAQSYDRDMTGVLTLEHEVAGAIAQQIQAKLTPAEQVRLGRGQKADPQAVELYLQGMQRLNSGNPQGAAVFFHEAISRDPNYAEAHASLATAYGWMGEAGWMAYEEAFSQQKAEAEKAIALDDSRPEPHLELGMAAMNRDWDWQTQKKEFERALTLNKNSSGVHWAYANYLIRTGGLENGIAEAKTALALDPVSSRSFMNVAFDYYYARQYEQALEQMRRAAELEANPQELRFPLGVIYIEKGLSTEGIQQFQQLGDVPHALGHLGNAYARLGRITEANATIEQLKQHVEKSGIGRYEIALIYAGMHRNDEAFAWLEKAYAVRDKGLTYLKIDPCLDPLRSDPRFVPLQKQIGIP